MSTILFIVLAALAITALQQGSRLCGWGRTGLDRRSRDELNAGLADLADQHDARLNDLEAHYEARLAELEERLDFAERLLAKKEPERLQSVHLRG